MDQFRKVLKARIWAEAKEVERTGWIQGMFKE